MPSVLAQVSAPNYLSLRKLLCPYCAVGLPDTHSSAVPPVWTHSIPGSGQTFSCSGNTLRAARLADGATDA